MMKCIKTAKLEWKLNRYFPAIQQAYCEGAKIGYACVVRWKKKGIYRWEIIPHNKALSGPISGWCKSMIKAQTRVALILAAIDITLPLEEETE